MASRDPYEVLGLPHSASRDEVKARFRSLALQLHPDLNPTPPGAAARFADVKRAADAILTRVGARERLGVALLGRHCLSFLLSTLRGWSTCGAALATAQASSNAHSSRSPP